MKHTHWSVICILRFRKNKNLVKKEMLSDLDSYRCGKVAFLSLSDRVCKTIGGTHVMKCHQLRIQYLD